MRFTTHLAGDFPSAESHRKRVKERQENTPEALRITIARETGEALKGFVVAGRKIHDLEEMAGVAEDKQRFGQTFFNRLEQMAGGMEIIAQAHATRTLPSGSVPSEEALLLAVLESYDKKVIGRMVDIAEVVQAQMTGDWKCAREEMKIPFDDSRGKDIDKQLQNAEKHLCKALEANEKLKDTSLHSAASAMLGR